MIKEPNIILQFILQKIELIEKRIKDTNRQKFIEDIDLQDMTIRRLEVIGEAVRSLPKKFREKYPDVNWKDPADMRSALIHGYLEVDLDVVWDTIIHDLPTFKEKIKKLLEESEKNL